MITATTWVTIDTLAQAPGSPHLSFAAITPLVVIFLLMGGFILAVSVLLTQPRPGPRFALITVESLMLVLTLAFIGIAAEITAPLALAIIVCLLLPEGRRPRRTTRSA